MIAIYDNEQGSTDAPPLKILLHFLDHEILHSFGLDKRKPKRILRELTFAFRVGLLLARDGVIIPASHRFESRYAGHILEHHKAFAELSLINLASNTLDIPVFFEQKQQHYSGDPERHPLYFEKSIAEVENESIARWILKENNSTADIIAEWSKSIGDSDTWSRVYRFSNVASVSQFERELALVPDRLEERAFVADFVVPLLPLKASAVVARFINTVIQRAYIASFLKCYNAACLSDLPLFDTTMLLPPTSPQYSVARAKRYFYQKRMLGFIEFSRAEDLLRFKFSAPWLSEWASFCRFTLLNPHSANISDHGAIDGGIMGLRLKQIDTIERHLNECVEVLEACYEDTLSGAVLKRSARKKIKEINELMSERESELLALLSDVADADKAALKTNLTIARDPESSDESKSNARKMILGTVGKIGEKIVDVGGDLALKLILRSAGIDPGQT